MGNCGSSSNAAVVVEQGGGTKSKTKPKPSIKAFQGTGHRLGAANELPQQSPTTQPPLQTNPSPSADVNPQPIIVDPTLSSDERQRQREARLAAAEKRHQHTKTVSPKTKKKPTVPLKGPNSEPLMRWS